MSTNSHTVRIFVLVSILVCGSNVHAWIGKGSSSSTTTSTSTTTNGIHGRRHFLETAVGGTLLSTATLLTPTPAYAAGKQIYKPTPGSMNGKVVIITGANTGLGLESSCRLAAAGATVVLTSRNPQKGAKAVETVTDYLATNGVTRLSGQQIVSLPLDLCDFGSIRAFPKLVSQTLDGDHRTVDVLLNNAGVMAIPDRRLTKDGFETTFQTNHLGHFLLTSELLPLISKEGDGGRVINVSSQGYLFAPSDKQTGGGLDIHNLNGEVSYGPWTSYGNSKLENILFTKELQARADTAGRKLTAVTLHPGAVQTDLARYLIGEDKAEKLKKEGFSSWTEKVLFEGLAKLVLTVEEGASTQVFLAAGQGGSGIGGKFFDDCKEAALQPSATDMAKAKELWTVSETLTGATFSL